MAVHTAARVCTAAHGGQIVATAEVKTALASVPKGLRFRPLGRHRVPGLPATVALYQVTVDGLPARFPPPRTAKL
jgi:class 3 adenylate cyclase